MKKREIKENNILIAEFMGWSRDNFYCMETFRDNPTEWFINGETPEHCFMWCSCQFSAVFHYDSIWACLMPVV